VETGRFFRLLLLFSSHCYVQSVSFVQVVFWTVHVGIKVTFPELLLIKVSCAGSVTQGHHGPTTVTVAALALGD
jgi:hypothetical protein